MQCKPVISAISALLLTGCATEAYRQAEAECATQAYASYPVMLEDRLMRQSRKAWVPDGSTICESTVTSLSSDRSRRTSVADESRESRETRDSGTAGAGNAERAANGGSSGGATAQKMPPAQKVNKLSERGSAVSMETTQAVQRCRPGMREVVEYYDEPVKVDVHAEARHHAIGSCSAALCMQRFGNSRCKK